jgi:hypothetical protein
MNDQSIQLGDEAVDTISGFKGVVIAITDWLNGCRRITIAPKELRDGKPIDSVTFDVEQLELVKKMKAPAAQPSGGPSISPARRPDPGR